MSKKNMEKQPIMPVLRTMPPGAVKSYPLHRFNIVKSSCNNVKMQYGYVYTTHINREASTIEVTRVK